MANRFYGGLLGNKLNDTFKLNDKIINEFKNKEPPFGFNGLGEIVYLRTYAREKENGEIENWIDTVERVVNGVFEILQHYIINKLHCNWDINKANFLAEDMFDRIFNMKFLPPGRGLWAMGSPIINIKGFAAALNNCAFVSTDNLKNDKLYPFIFLMDASMLGVGVGFDTIGAGSFIIKKPDVTLPIINHIISDDREGWVESVRLLLDGFFNEKNDIIFDYSNIRELGKKLKTFGGTSSGPGPLITLHKNIRKLLVVEYDKPISVTCITDIMNMIGVCTVSGNIRRCLPKNSKVHTKQGLVNIQDINIGDLVLTFSGYEKVTCKYEQGQQQLIKIVTQDGEFSCTNTHHMAVMIGPNKYVWKMAKDLNNNDKLITTRVAIPGIQTNLPIDDDISIPNLDADLAWFIGMFHGQGHIYPHYLINKSTSNMCVICNIYQYDIALKVLVQFRRFGLNLNIFMRENRHNKYVITCTNKKLLDYFSKYIKNTGNMEIPEYINKGTLDVRLGYISGIMDSLGDNTIYPIRVSYHISKNWINQIQHLCYSCGFESNIQRLKNHVINDVCWKNAYTLRLITKYSIMLLNNIPQLFKKIDVSNLSLNIFKYNLLTYNKYNDVNNINNDDSEILLSISEYYNNRDSYHITSIISTEPYDIEETYDITVENKQEFYCNGYLTHNSAEIAFGQADCKEFLNLKSYDVNPQRQEHGWASNNSIFATIGMDYSEITKHLLLNGEPGFAWLSNMRSYSRMNGFPDNKDIRVAGGNPCLEQSLESMELCCLVETFPTKHEDINDFHNTLKSAFLFAKTVTLLPLHWQKSNEIMMRNRRIGCSVSGIAQFITKYNIDTLKQWLESGYDILKEVDKDISEWLCIRQSIKITSVKPSGTVSLLAGVTPGIHYPESQYYIRRVRISRDSFLVNRLIKAGYHVEPCVMCPESTIVVEFPVSMGDNIKTTRDISIWEQLSLAAFMQKYWADNQVSATITFDPITEGHHIASALNYFQYQLKGISFLPHLNDNTIYKQIPYEKISKEQYNNLIKKINKNVSLSLNVKSIATDEDHYNYCDNDKCVQI
jgi:intein/homing endonuclease